MILVELSCVTFLTYDHLIQLLYCRYSSLESTFICLNCVSHTITCDKQAHQYYHNKFLHSISATLFYLLGISFFGSYLLQRNLLGGLWPKWWMEVADLPLILIAGLFGGTSLYLSLTKGEKRSIIAMIFIGIPLIALFLFFVALNFWEVLSS